jgi:hypothetical protein
MQGSNVAAKRKSSAYENNVKSRHLSKSRREQEDGLSSSNQDIGVIGNGLRKT